MSLVVLAELQGVHGGLDPRVVQAVVERRVDGGVQVVDVLVQVVEHVVHAGLVVLGAFGLVVRIGLRVPKLEGSIGEGSNHSNFSNQSSVKILPE